MDGYIRHTSIKLKNWTDITVNSPRRVIKNRSDSQKCTVQNESYRVNSLEYLQ